MFREIIFPIFRSTRLCFTACGIMHPRCCVPATSWVHYTTSCNTQSSAPEDGRNHRPKHVELIWIVNKPLLLHLVGCLYYLHIRRVSGRLALGQITVTTKKKLELKCCILFLSESSLISFHLRITSGEMSRRPLLSSLEFFTSTHFVFIFVNAKNRWQNSASYQIPVISVNIQLLDAISPK